MEASRERKRYVLAFWSSAHDFVCGAGIRSSFHGPSIDNGPSENRLNADDR